MVIQTLSKEEIIAINKRVLDLSSDDDFAILNEGNLEIAVAAPNQEVFGYIPFQTLNEKAAALFHELNKLHPFFSANKRTAFTAMDIFLRLNGWMIKAEFQESVDISVNTARCSVNIQRMAEWIEGHVSRSLE